MKQKINHILFDVGGVLTFLPKFDFFKIDEKFSLDRGQAESIFHDCFKVQTDNKDIDVEMYFNENYSQYISFNNYQEMLNEIYGGEKLNIELVSWIREYENRYSFSVLLNNSAVLNDLLREKFQIYGDFDNIFNSAEIGLTKLDPKIFNFVLNELAVPAAQRLFIDDRLDNVGSACSVGFNAI